MKTPLTCATCRIALPWFFTERLPIDEQRAVAEHVATCAACRDELTQWQAVAVLFREDYEAQLPRADTDAGWHDLLTRLPPQPLSNHVPVRGVTYMDFDEQHINLPPTEVRLPQRGSRFGRAVPAFALAAVVVLAALSAGVFSLLHGRNGTYVGPAASSTVPATPTSVLPVFSTLAPNGYIFSASFVTPTDIWAVGNYYTSGVSSALIVHYQDGQWQEVSKSDFPTIDLQGVAMVSATEGWAIGIKNAKISGSTALQVLLHYQNGHWGPASLPALPATGYSLHSIQMFSATTGIITALGAKGDLLILRYQGGTWRMSDPHLSGPSYLDTTVHSDVSALSVNDIWARGDHAIRHFDGTQWTTKYTGETGTHSIVAIDARADNDVWAQVSDLTALPTGDVSLSDGQPLSSRSILGTQPANSLLHFDGTTWQTVAIPASLPSNAVLLGFVDHDWLAIMLVGANLNVTDPGYLLHLTGGQWQVTRTPVSDESILAVTTDSANEVWAASSAVRLNADGKQVTVMQRLHYQNGHWSLG